MTRLSLKGKDLRKLGYKNNKVISRAIQVMHGYYKHAERAEALAILANVLGQPAQFANDTVLGKFASLMVETKHEVIPQTELNRQRKPYEIFGSAHIEPGAVNQMEVAMKLPVAVSGALMPDAHQGYGLPIGGVLATHDAVIPYAVGVDIGCRMSMTIFNADETVLKGSEKKLLRVLDEHAVFGSGRSCQKPMDDEVLERREFYEIPVLKTLHKKAMQQIGSSGSGNHFVEFGYVEIAEERANLRLKPGKYLALLSHSGSRGLGAGIATYYTKLAMDQCRLPGVARHLAWLDMNKEEGMAYWIAMNLAGDYAKACHDHIHYKISKALGYHKLMAIENHHNFAWREKHNGEEVIVHRKGATPAGKGQLGIIPGSMTQPGFIVSGRGEPASLSSASHGAGRALSRSHARSSITPKMLKDDLKKHGVTLIGGGVDEAPQAYKNVQEVMASQKALVDICGIFYPSVVKMDG